MKKTLLFCSGPSGSGKTYFIKNTLPTGLFYSLRSATTRPMRDGESEGNPYFFRDEDYFETEPLATRLWVNQKIWQPGMPKWLYGVLEFEVYEHLGQNLIYDVIEPKYARQMISWFVVNKLNTEYDFKIAYFVPPQNNMKTVESRANMPNDTTVRTLNKCNNEAFHKAGLVPDYTLCPINGVYDAKLTAHIKQLQKQY